MAHCSQYSAISRNYLYTTSWDLRGRTGFSGQVGVHGGQHSLHFNSTFWGNCGEIMRVLDLRVSKSIDFIGDIGAGFCKSGYHGSARALDISQVRYTDGTYIDTNYSWRGTTTHKRWYVGLAAQCRLVVGTVLTAWYNAEHQNHIHIDNGTGFVPLRTSARSDATLVQAACNILNGESLSIDGAWGPLTEAAYNRLRSDFRMTCTNPKSNSADAGLFFGLMAQTGLNGQAAGVYQGYC
jgi:hypothetical protein